MSFIVQPQVLLAIGPSRKFGSSQYVFSDYVTITENTTDELEITQHPVQQGAPVTDHAFKKPFNLSIQIQFSPGLFQSLSTTYDKLLKLQNSRVPFTVSTPKRVYKNMLFKALGVTTDKTRENILSINCSFQNIILVPIVTGSVPRSSLSTPGSNSATQAAGSKSFIKSISQALSGLFGGGG